jgi:hypothetical protein
MARYHCDKVSEQLQQVKGVEVTNITRSSWTFKHGSARLNLRVLPGCCGVLLVYQLTGAEKELARLLKQILRAANKANFGIVLMSLRSDSRFRALLPTAAPGNEGWASIKFTNPRTRNEVELLSYAIPLKPAKKKPQVYDHEDN